MNERFILEDEGKIKIYCAPHNEFINTDAQILIIGITLGWTQTQIAFKTAYSIDFHILVVLMDIERKCLKTIRRIIYMKDMIENLNATTIFIILFFLLVFFLSIHVFLIYFRHTNWKKRA